MSESASFIPLFVGLLLSVAGADSSCPLELSPPSVVVRYGDPVSSNCSTSETLFEGIGWEVTHGATGLQEVKHLTWSLDSLTQWSISPICFITPNENSTTEQCFKTLEIVVYTFPDTIYISSDSVWGGQVKEFMEYDFTCVIPNIAPVQNLTVKWYKGDELLKTQTFENPSKVPVNQSSVLSFSPTRQDNGVPLRCEAHLNLDSKDLNFNVSSHQYNITVQYGPELHCSDEGVLEGETIEEKCQVTGNPTPFVKWTKDGQPVDPAIFLSREDSGLYAVEAEGATLLNKTVEILVFSLPDTIYISSDSVWGGQVKEFMEYDFTCVIPNIAPVRNLTVKWYKGDELLKTQTFENPSKVPVNQSPVLSFSPTRQDNGVPLRCEAHLNLGSNDLNYYVSSQEYNITVQYGPELHCSDEGVLAGESIEELCQVTGNPTPFVKWTKDGQPVDPAIFLSREDSGLYAVEAEGATLLNKTVEILVFHAKQECPIEITPDGMVIQYQERSKKATCKPTTNSSNVKEINWLDQQGLKTNTSWTVDTHKDWDFRPYCVGIFRGIGLCKKRLNFTLYKTPDSVSIRTIGDVNSVVEDNELKLQCDITNIAPAQNLTVLWYRGNETIKPLKESTRVTGCLENNTTCDIGVTQSPLNVSSIISITMNRTHNGAELRCEVQLDLGPEGPKPVPSMTSSTLNITVYYKPVINTTKLAKRVPVFSGYPEDLLCEADGHPPPNIVWLFSPDTVPHVSKNKLTVSEAGFYNCTATNEVDSISYEVEVILKEDYLPLIAGFVAVTVIAISIIFVFFYSIYYKNTKMRRYSLKNPKLSTHNGNVAHNGWDLQFPMTTLS